MGEKSTVRMELFIGKEKEGSYFELPFEVPSGVFRITVKYKYERHSVTEIDGVKKTEEINIIDFGLSSNTGEFVGASGSDRDKIWVSEFDSSDGFSRARTDAGVWNIIVGAYKVHEEGVKVTYEVAFEFKERVLLKGDCHAHTTGSDGILSVQELTDLARENRLDFIFITDHNNYSHNNKVMSSEALTVIPGVEWTHFKGHANFMGVERAFFKKYYANTIDEVNEILDEARSNGAIVSINHPFDAGCPWKWGLENVEFDCVEIWNGIIKQSDMQCIQWWHRELCGGRRLPIIGGSDFHKFEDFSMLGHPTTWLYSMSRGQSDIMDAIRNGHAFVTLQPDAPRVFIGCRNLIIGDEVQFEEGMIINFEFSSLKKGDIIKIYSAFGIEKEIPAEQGSLSFEIKGENKRFYRAEVHRQLLPYLPPMLCLITNPIYIR